MNGIMLARQGDCWALLQHCYCRQNCKKNRSEISAHSTHMAPGTPELDSGHLQFQSSHLQLQTHNSKRAAPVASLCGECGVPVPKGGSEGSPSILS